MSIAPLQPYDEHNRRLESRVHPPSWTNPTPAGRYNLVVIGAGTAGLIAAIGAAGLGAKVALVERELLGGDCLNVGCVPSKAVISSARIAAAVADAPRFGVRVAGAEVDFPAAMERMRRLRADISEHDAAQRFRDMGIDVYLGQASFTSPSTAEVEGTTLQFKKAVVATGARAAAPPIEGLAEAGCLTNETLFSLTELPGRLAVIGGGPIGSEMAQSFARFGSQVTLIEKAEHILSREDRDAAEIVQQAMRRDGVELLLEAEVQRVERRDGGKVVVAQTPQGTREIPCDELLVGIGRAPNVEGMGLEQAGVKFDTRQGVEVDDRLRTSNPRIYAAGDVASPLKFTHAADFMARLVIQNALFLGRGKASSLVIPWTTYTSPEVAHVGLSQRQAQQQGVAVDTFTQELARVDRAILEDESEGFVRVHVRRGSDRIAGATIVAANAGDMIGELSLAMTHNIGLKKIASAIHPYPTQGEAIRKVGDLYNRTRLKPWIKRLMEAWLRWTR